MTEDQHIARAAAALDDPGVRRETIAYDAAGIRLTPDLPPRPVNTPPSAQDHAPDRIWLRYDGVIVAGDYPRPWETNPYVRADLIPAMLQEARNEALREAAAKCSESVVLYNTARSTLAATAADDCEQDILALIDAPAPPAPLAVDPLHEAIATQLSEGLGAILRKFCDSTAAMQARHYLHAMPDSDWNTLITMLSEEIAKASRAALAAAPLPAPAPAPVDPLREALERAHTLLYFDLRNMIEWGPDYNQAVKDVADRISIALAQADEIDRLTAAPTALAAAPQPAPVDPPREALKVVRRQNIALLRRQHEAACFDQGDHEDEVDTAFSMGADAIEQVAALVAAPQPAPVDREKLVEALRAQRQADADGVLVTVSRQAVDEAISLIAAGLRLPGAT